MMKVLALATLAVGARYLRDPKPELAVHSMANLTGLHMLKLEYPCGDDAKNAGVKDYMDRLVEGTCGLETAQPFCGDASGFSCMLKNFYAADCAGFTKAPADLCEKCTSLKAMGAGTPGLPATYFPLELKNFYKSDYVYFETVLDSQVLHDELLCASMMMVQDGCASGTTIPSCFK